MKKVIGIDLMGSDSDVAELIQGISEPEDIELKFYVTEPILKKLPKSSPCQITESFIEMSEDPLVAVRKKPHSSLLTGIKELEEGKIDAFISSGNTGALIAASAIYLKMSPGIHRPALLALIPGEKRPFVLIDVGGIIACKEKDLTQFAQIGAEFQKKRGVIHPKVALLNIGVESMKGTGELKKAFLTLSSQENEFDFIGNLEGREVFNADIDVLVTDGFSGNIFLKTAEGVSNLIFNEMKKIGMSRELDELKKKFSYEDHPGAFIIGIEKIVIKCHGHTTINSIKNSIEEIQKII